MAQYVLQIQTEGNGVNIGWLTKSFEVTEKYPIPAIVPDKRQQVILTNSTSFNAIVGVYSQYRNTAIFSYDAPGAEINCTGPVTDTWPIN